MGEDYTQMWTDLGLDLEKHDALLSVLGQAYQDIFLAQQNRPKGMEYFDFVMSEVHGLRIKEIVDAKAAGRLVVGSFCTFVPEELILAIDGVCIGLCAGAEFGTDAAEKIIPRNTCSLIKSAFGFALEKVCPYVEASDLVVGENTCDGKKKSFEQYANLVNAFYSMDLPQTKSAEGKNLLKAEFKRFAEKIQEMSGKTITVESLKNAIDVVNKKRAAMHRLSKLRAAKPSVISGLDSLLMNQVYFYDDPHRFTDSVNKICDELEERIAEKKEYFKTDSPRILVSGCPMAVPNWKMHSIIESCGAIVVGDESCVGDRGTQTLTGNRSDTIDGLLDAIVERYQTIDCAIYAQNPTREQHVKALYDETGADGVIQYTLQFCTPYLMESMPMENSLEDSDIPTLRTDTDYSAEDAEQLRTRVEAFIERIKG